MINAEIESKIEQHLDSMSDLCFVLKRDHEKQKSDTDALFANLEKACVDLGEQHKTSQTRIDATIRHKMTEFSHSIAELERNIGHKLMKESTGALEHHIGRVQNASDDAVRTLNAFKNISIKNIAYTILATVVINALVTTSLVYVLSPQKTAKTNGAAHQYYKGMEIVDH